MDDPRDDDDPIPKEDLETDETSANYQSIVSWEGTEDVTNPAANPLDSTVKSATDKTLQPSQTPDYRNAEEKQQRDAENEEMQEKSRREGDDSENHNMSEEEEDTQQPETGVTSSDEEENQHRGKQGEENTNMHNLDTERESGAVEETREKQEGEKKNREAIGYVKIEVGDYIIYARDWSRL
jgi:hypothetical protein